MSGCPDSPCPSRSLQTQVGVAEPLKSGCGILGPVNRVASLGWMSFTKVEAGRRLKAAAKGKELSSGRGSLGRESN